MKITSAMVMSADGRTTRGNEPPSGWASKEDQRLFHELRDKASLIVMGVGTYESVKTTIHLNPNKRRIVLTNTPDKYKADTVPGSLEFSTETPSELVKRLTREGHDDMLLVGGSITSAGFYNANLVDELYLTVEPLLFGSGRPLVGQLTKTVGLRLLSVRQLNQQGTLLLHFRVTPR